MITTSRSEEPHESSDNVRIFHKNGYFLQLTKEENESIDTFIERGNYIVNMKPKNRDEIDKYIVYSKIWINNKKYQNEYDSELIKNVDYCSHNRLHI